METTIFSVSLQHLVTVGRDFACSVWSGNQMAAALNWEETMPQVAAKSHRYLACRSAKMKQFNPAEGELVDMSSSVSGLGE